MAVGAGKVFVMALNEEGEGDNSICSVYNASDLEHVCSFGLWNNEESIEWRGGLAATASRLFVADPLRHCIDVFALGDWSKGEKPKPISRLGEKGKLPGQFLQPRGLALLDDRLIVAEFHGQRLQVLTLEGLPLQVIPTASHLVSVSVSSEQVICGAVASGPNQLLPPAVINSGSALSDGHFGISLLVFSVRPHS